MNVTGIETLRHQEFPNLLFVRVHTDQGLTGLGETFFGAEAVDAYVHETAAPYLLGRDALQIDAHARALYGYLGYRSTGVEMRGSSALDIALHDLLGKAAGLPLYQLLGGRTRQCIRVYNTCAGYRYVRRLPVQEVGNWGLPDPGESSGPYEDLEGFLHRADELAQSLLEQGITGMKIWPFDPYAESSGGHHISAADLSEALEPFRRIRRAVGDRMDVMVEFHSLWDLPTAKRIARALEEFDIYWFEDPLKADDLDALEEFWQSTEVTVTLSETLATRWSYRELFNRRFPGVCMLDVSWCGGVGEARKIASMAEASQLPVAPHDCTGPVVLAASTHLSAAAPNALVQEIVRAYYTGWYRELVTELPRIEDGFIWPLEAPGLGTELQPGFERRPGVTARWSRL